MPQHGTRRPSIDTHRHPIGRRLRDKMVENGLFDPSRPLPQANAEDIIFYPEFINLDDAMPKQRDGGVTLSLASNGGEVEWIARGLLRCSTPDALRFLNDEYRELMDRYPGEFLPMANAHAANGERPCARRKLPSDD